MPFRSRPFPDTALPKYRLQKPPLPLDDDTLTVQQRERVCRGLRTF
jgi:hypothetical protein